MDAKKLKAVLPRRVRRPLGITRRWLRALPSRTSRQKERLLASGDFTSDERKLLGRVESRISHEDGMYTGDGDHYFRVGLSAVHCINDALSKAGIFSVGKILDLPCGYGRVMRFLVHLFPDAQITACELDRGPVRFCTRIFGARPTISSINLDEVAISSPFDLIWCGSLITHLNERAISSLLRLFRRHLSAGGLAVFTTHGDFVAQRLPARDFDYGLAEEAIDRLPDEYSMRGFSFADYPGEKDWGVSITSPDWIRARVSQGAGWREVYFKARGWDDHQDVFGFVAE